MFDVAASAAVGGLSLVQRCGERECPPYQYCSFHAESCEPCESICKLNTNNFDQNICEAQCQDYIHDYIKHYWTDEDFHKATQNFQETIDYLRNLTAASLLLSALLLIGLVVFGGFLWLRQRRLVKKEQDLMEKKLSSLNTIVNNNVGAGMLNHKPPSSASQTAAPSVITEVTHLSRRPEEDATLEFAYDNEGLVPSPVIRDPRDETMF